MEFRISALCCFIFLIVQRIECMEYEGCFNTCLNATDTDDRCVYERIGQKCYYQFNKLTNWEENRQLCIERGLEMVRLSEETLTDINQLHFQNKYDPFLWIGGKAEHKTEWMFVNDTAAVSQTSMVIGFTDSSRIWHQCGFLDTENFSLKTDMCRNTKSFLCRFGDDVTAYKEEMTWTRARGRCLLDGGDLFVMRSDPDELPFQDLTILIWAALIKSGIDKGASLHIGVEHRSWHWLNGDPVIGPSNWLINHYDQNCVDVAQGGYWHEWYCDKTFMAFCQNFEAVFEEPTTESEHMNTGISSSPVSGVTREITSRATGISSSAVTGVTHETTTTKGATSTTENICVVYEETNGTMLRALIATGTLMGIFFIGNVILAALLIMKITQERRDKNAYVDPDSAMSKFNDAYVDPGAVTQNDKNTYSELNLVNLDMRKAKVEEPSQGNEYASITSNGSNTYTTLDVATLDSSKLAYEGPQVYVNCQVITGKPSEKTK